MVADGANDGDDGVVAAADPVVEDGPVDGEAAAAEVVEEGPVDTDVLSGRNADRCKPAIF